MRYPRLDVLVNNAGTIQLDRRQSADGIELTFATNVLGYHLLARELMPLLSAPARIVIVASMFASDLDLDDLEFQRRPYEALRAYAQSKVCNRLLTWALARRLSAGVTANAMAPGFVPGTDLSRNLAEETRRAYKGRSGRTIAQGADTAIWLASSPAVANATGRLFFDREDLECQFRNTEVEERLWSICETLTSE
jgi:NAD(P)-dependent dehydrogenase (short-subunit alcohol dehydrogenase family)